MVSPLDAMRVSSALTMLKILKAEDAAESGRKGTAPPAPSYPGIDLRSSALRTGNVLGTIIEIASRGSNQIELGVRTVSFTGNESMKRDYVLSLWGANGDITTTSDHAGGYLDTFAGTALGMPEDEHEQYMIDAAEARGGPLSPYIIALKNDTVQKIDLATMGVTSKMTNTIHHYADGGTDSATKIEVSGLNEFKSQHTEIKEGTLYDKATGKLALIGQNGSKYTYYIFE